MKATIRGLIVLVLVVWAGLAGRASAGAGLSFQTVPSVGGWTFQVPADWTQQSASPSQPNEVNFVGTDGEEDAIGQMVPIAIYPLSASSLADVAVRGGLSALTNDPSDTALNAPTFTVVAIPGADAAEEGTQSFALGDVNVNAYAIAAVQGQQGYGMVVVVSTNYDAANPDVAPSILDSLQYNAPSPVQAIAPPTTTTNSSVSLPVTSSPTTTTTTSAPTYVPALPVAVPSGPFIPYPGNGGGPTQCADGTVSHSSGRGTCSHHGGEG